MEANTFASFHVLSSDGEQPGPGSTQSSQVSLTNYIIIVNFISTFLKQMMLGKALKMSILRRERVGPERVDGTVCRC